MQLYSIILGASSCAITSLAWGLLCVKQLKLRINRLECICIAYVLGSALVSTLALALALAMVARKGVFLSLAAVSLPLLSVGLRHLRSCEPLSLKPISRATQLLFVAGFVWYGVLYMRQALTPDTSGDSMTYHLGFVNLWNGAHGMTRLVDMYAGMPAGLEMLFLFAFSIGRHNAADLIHLSFLLVLPVMMVLYALRFGLGGTSGACAGLLLFATPLVGWDGSVGYNDVALATTLFTSFYLLQLWRRENTAGTLFAAALAAGFSLAVKYTAVLGIVFLGLLLLWQFRRRSCRNWGVLAGALIIAGSLAVPYYVRNFYWYRDPIFPFGNALFPNPYFHLSSERGYIEGQVHLNGLTLPEMPRELTIGGTKLPDSLGPLYVLAPFALLGLAWPETRPLAIGFLTLGCAALSNKSARFLIPALPFCLLTVASVFERAGRAGAPLLVIVAVGQLVISWPPLIDKIGSPHGERCALTPWSEALRTVPEESYLANHSQEYVMSRAIENYVPDHAPVFALAGGFAQAYTTHFVFDSYHSAQAEVMGDLFYSNADSPQVTRRVWRVTLPDTNIEEINILQTGLSPEDWHINEIQLFWRGERLKPNRPEVRALPSPSEGVYAADDSYATRWRSWDATRPGQAIGVRYADRPMVDRVDVDCGEGQWQSQMDVRGKDQNGGTIMPTARTWVAAPPLDLRKAATAELKREGIHYVVISQDAWRSERFRKYPQAWGLTEIFSGRNATLYRID